MYTQPKLLASGTDHSPDKMLVPVPQYVSFCKFHLSQGSSTDTRKVQQEPGAQDEVWHTVHQHQKRLVPSAFITNNIWEDECNSVTVAAN